MWPVGKCDGRHPRGDDRALTFDLEQKLSTHDVNNLTRPAAMAACIEPFTRLQLPLPHLEHVGTFCAREKHGRAALRSGPELARLIGGAEAGCSLSPLGRRA